MTPLILLSHRKQEFLPRALASIKEFGRGIGDILVVDDSGDENHRQWLRNAGIEFVPSDVFGRNAGYYAAMNTIWDIAGPIAEKAGSDYVFLWEEDFVLQRALDVSQMIEVMDEHPGLAQLNLQRQAVYKVEKRFGYMESHQRRGYDLRHERTNAILWVSRERPFTTNPGLLRVEATKVPWPPREVCDAVVGGAEPAMSLALENDQWYFGWYGAWNSPHVRHEGTAMKTGHGY